MTPMDRNLRLTGIAKHSRVNSSITFRGWILDEAIGPDVVVFKLVEAVQKLATSDGHNQLPKLVLGVKFADGSR